MKKKMWARIKTLNLRNKGGKGNKEAKQSLSVNEEYGRAIRTKSYADFFDKAQSLVINQPSFCIHKFNDNILLEPGQETISSLLESATLSNKSDLKDLIINYFDISAEASKICTHLLRSLNRIQTNYTYIQQVLDSVDNEHFSPQDFHINISELRSFISLSNPFSNLGKQDFKAIRDKYSSFLHNLKSKRKRITRKINLIKYFNKASGVFVTAACGVVAVAAMVLAAHTLTALLMGPVILTIPIKPVKKKLMNFKFLRSGVLSKVGKQLDVAAKGTYILNRDFDTMSRLVARLHDEIEHNKTMIQLCLDRREDRSFSLHVIKELKKNDVGFKKQVEELEEHVYLCLVTINRARALMIKEINGRSCL